MTNFIHAKTGRYKLIKTSSSVHNFKATIQA